MAEAMDVEQPRGRIVKLEIEGFKSFGGTHTVDFRERQNFTAVVGPNGAGKSNLMDAISYVLGLQARHLRSSKLIELLHRGPSQSRRKASVTLTYERDNDIVVFSRTISAVGVGAYWLDNQEVTRDKYENALKEIGVLVKARNFLVFQGDVESLASKSQDELTAVWGRVRMFSSRRWRGGDGVYHAGPRASFRLRRPPQGVRQAQDGERSSGSSEFTSLPEEEGLSRSKTTGEGPKRRGRRV